MEYYGFIVNFQGQFKPNEFHPGVLFQYQVEDRNLANLIRMYNFTENLASFSIYNTYYYMDNTKFQINDNVSDVQMTMNKLNLFMNSMPNIDSQAFNLYRFLHFKLDNQDLWNQKKSQHFNSIGKIFSSGTEMSNTDNVSKNLASIRFYSTQNFDNFVLTKNYSMEESFFEGTKNGIYILVHFNYHYQDTNVTSILNQLAQQQIEVMNSEAMEVFKHLKEVFI